MIITLRACRSLVAPVVLLAALASSSTFAQAQAPAAAMPVSPATAAGPMAPATGASTVMAEAHDDKLFLALGGRDGIRSMTHDFVAQLAADPRIGHFFEKTNLPHLEEMLSLQFCTVSGGDCIYTGAPMKLAHDSMDIRAGDFNALVEVLQSTLTQHGVAFSTQNEFLARLAPMHRDIVNTH